MPAARNVSPGTKLSVLPLMFSGHREQDTCRHPGDKYARSYHPGRCRIHGEKDTRIDNLVMPFSGINTV